MKTSKWRLLGMGASCSALTYLNTWVFYDGLSVIPMLILMGLSVFCTVMYMFEKDVD